MGKNENYKFILIIALAAVVGVFIGIVGSVFHMSIDFIVHSKTQWIKDWWMYDTSYMWIPYVVTSTIMIYIAIHSVRRFAPEAGGSGVQEIEGILEDKRKMRSIRVLFIKFFGGILSLGGGMVMGREGPTIQMGGALGHLVAKYTKLDNNDVKILISAGAGAGLAVAFNAPIAGMFFVLEEMRKQFRYTNASVHAVVVASLVSVIVLHMILGDYISIPVHYLPSPTTGELWIFVILGVLYGFFGYVFNILLIKFADLFIAIKGASFHIASIFIGAFVGFLLWIWPDSVGEGFGVIHQMLHGNFSLYIILLLLCARFFMTMLSYGTSAPGGIFAPMLALGTLFGLGFGIIINLMIPHYPVDSYIFAIVGMSALFSATVRAPLTGIMLILELTHSYTLVLPLIITSILASIVASMLGVRPIYTVLLERTMKIAKFGKIEPGEPDVNKYS